MSQKHPSGQRLLCAAGITLALLGLATQTASAQETEGESLTVVRDAQTGKLRAPTAEEAAALKAKTAAKLAARRVAAPPPPTMKYHKSGATGMRMTDESLTTAVAVRKADGSVEQQCFETHGAATTAIAQGHIHANKVETE